MSATNPEALTFTIEDGSGAIIGTATAKLLWDKAPLTCGAICKQLPIESTCQLCSCNAHESPLFQPSATCFHGKNSGAEALLVTPGCISDLPQDDSESATQTHDFGNVLFGFEPAGFCVGGAGSDDCSEIAWIYGEAAQACFWVSENGPPHDKPPYRRQPATLNHFAQIMAEDGFYAASKNLIKTGELRVVVQACATI